jgi:hypothetical protein
MIRRPRPSLALDSACSGKGIRMAACFTVAAPQTTALRHIKTSRSPCVPARPPRLPWAPAITCEAAGSPSGAGGRGVTLEPHGELARPQDHAAHPTSPNPSKPAHCRSTHTIAVCQQRSVRRAPRRPTMSGAEGAAATGEGSARRHTFSHSLDPDRTWTLPLMMQLPGLHFIQVPLALR